MLFTPKQLSPGYGFIEQAKSDQKYTEIGSAFYFDLTLRTLLTVKKMMTTQSWPDDMPYLTCDNYNGSNTPDRSLDLKSFFVDVPEPPTYGSFAFTTDVSLFNGNSKMQFDMDIFSVSMRNGIEYKENLIGNWAAGFSTPLQIHNAELAVEVHKPTKIYRVGTILKPPFIVRDNTTGRGYSGMSIDIMDTVAALADFDYVIVEADGHGRIDDNGTWSGIVGMLVDKEIDIGLGTMQIWQERETAIDFTIPYYGVGGFDILMARPKPKNALFKFMTVLELDVWLCIFGAYFLTSTLLYVFDRWSPFSYRNSKDRCENDGEKKIFTVKECLWFSITSITPQGGGEAPKNLSGRMVAATWWLFGFIVIASYTANLAAYLTISRLEKPIENLDDLAKQFKFLYAPVNGSEAQMYFERMSEIEECFYEIWKDMSLNESLTPLERSKFAVWECPVSDKFTKIWQAMQEAGLPKNLEEAVERVRSSSNSNGFALVDDAADIHYIEQYSCDFHIIGKEFSKKPYALGVQKGSPLKEVLDSALLKIVNENFIEKLRVKYMTKTLSCPKMIDLQDGIRLGNIGGVFVIIVVGIILSILTLIFEYFWFKYYKKPVRYIDEVEYGEGKSNMMRVSHSSNANARRPKAPINRGFRSRTISHIQIVETNNFKK